MAKGYYKDVAAELRACGLCVQGKCQGPHEKWAHEKTSRIQIVPRTMKSRHTANAILQAIGSNKKL